MDRLETNVDKMVLMLNQWLTVMLNQPKGDHATDTSGNRQTGGDGNGDGASGKDRVA